MGFKAIVKKLGLYPSPYNDDYLMSFYSNDGNIRLSNHWGAQLGILNPDAQLYIKDGKVNETTLFLCKKRKGIFNLIGEVPFKVKMPKPIKSEGWIFRVDLSKLIKEDRAKFIIATNFLNTNRFDFISGQLSCFLERDKYLTEVFRIIFYHKQHPKLIELQEICGKKNFTLRKGFLINEYEYKYRQFNLSDDCDFVNKYHGIKWILRRNQSNFARKYAPKAGRRGYVGKTHKELNDIFLATKKSKSKKRSTIKLERFVEKFKNTIKNENN